VTTENVAVLFTDMVGSTALASSLTADGADQLRRAHFSMLRQAVAETGGTEVKNLGDGLMVVFGSASAALSCAVAMQQRVERHNRDSELSVGLRVGLSIGEVSREDHDYFGDAVVEAARLCAACGSGQVLAAEMVRGMAGRRSRHQCRSVGELALKGLSDPVSTVEVVWDPIVGTDSGTVISLPARLGVRPAVGVVGRGAETSSMVDAFKRVAAGQGREALLVSGEAGLGKTTLVAQAARTLFDAGACVLFGHCEEDLASPYQLFSEALGHYVNHAPDEELVAHVAAYGSELARLVPALATRVPELPTSRATDTDTERFLLFAAVVGLLAEISRRQPVVLVLDDLQWADKASMLLFRHLIASELTMRVLVLGTYRDTELSRSHPFLDTLAALRRQPGVSRIELAGLDDVGVIALMEAMAGHRLDDTAVGLAQALYRETDGNPFFVSEVLRHLAETGAISQDATGRWTADDSLERNALPDSVREVIGARVGRLGSDAERVLSIAAVIGRDFDLDLLAAATTSTEGALLDVLDAAAAAALVRELAEISGRYCFAHALIQHTLYEDLGPTRRARAHRQVAEALEDLHGDHLGTRVEELARHWCNATQPVDLTKAVSYSQQAGDAALAALAPADALRHYAQALNLHSQMQDPAPSLGIDLAIGLGTAQRQTGDPAFHDTLIGAARRAAEMGDGDRLVAAVLANDRGFTTAVGTVDADKVEILESALEHVPEDHPNRALVLATLCSEITFGSTLERRQALADEAVAIAETCGDDAIVVRVLNLVKFPLMLPSLVEQSLERAADALVRAERVGDPLLLHWAALYGAIAAGHAGDIDEVDRCHAIAGPMAKQLDQPGVTWGYTFNRAWRAQLAGNTDRAEELATTALQLGTDSGQPDASMIYGVQLAIVSWQRGNLGDLIPLIEQMITENPGLPVLAGLLAVAHAEADRTDDARHLLAQFAATAFDLPLDMTWLTGMVLYAEADIECRDPQYAQPLIDLLAAWAGQLSGAGAGSTEGPVSHYLGGLSAILGRYEQADTYFAQAAELSDHMGAKFFAARTNLQWAKMLAERNEPGDTEKARKLLTNAHTTASDHGYANVERRAAEALKHTP
jgi:class 3 adenylate cyclase/tetratricopeptide (TPR) repeat protein/KaiC/GvpD/RAD55 family RecA-like ATPase